MADTVSIALIGASAAVASGLIGVGGVLLGVRFTARNEERRSGAAAAQETEKWRRDQRRSAYADVIQAADDYRKAARDLHVAPNTPPGNYIGPPPPSYVDVLQGHSTNKVIFLIEH
jgi:hypothetical protein